MAAMIATFTLKGEFMSQKWKAPDFFIEGGCLYKRCGECGDETLVVPLAEVKGKISFYAERRIEY